MKKILAAAATAAMVVIVLAGSAFAATAVTGVVPVNATVSSSCTAIVPGTLTLLVDPSTAIDVGSTGSNSTVQCTLDTPYTVNAASANSGLNDSTGTLTGALSSAGLTDIPYTLTFNPSFTGAGIGNNITLIIGNGGAKVLTADANAAQAGSYSDNVTLTVSY